MPYIWELKRQRCDVNGDSVVVGVSIVGGVLAGVKGNATNGTVLFSIMVIHTYPVKGRKKLPLVNEINTNWWA